jgi:hypothetical protein
MICRSGGQIVPGMESRLVQDLDDDLSLVYFDLDRPPPAVAMRLPFVQRLLRVPPDAGADNLDSRSVWLRQQLFDSRKESAVSDDFPNHSN